VGLFEKTISAGSESASFHHFITLSVIHLFHHLRLFFALLTAYSLACILITGYNWLEYTAKDDFNNSRQFGCLSSSSSRAASTNTKGDYDAK
jgi:hypothetical protein